MLDMGFEPQIRRIVEQSDMAPKHARQTLMFSATFATAVQRVAESYLNAPHAHVAVGRVGSSIGSISQVLVRCDDGHKRSKLKLLRPLLKRGERTIVFCQKKHVATWLRGQLANEGISAADVHGDRSQGQRETALNRFREGEVRARRLSAPYPHATDLAAAHAVLYAASIRLRWTCSSLLTSSHAALMWRRSATSSNSTCLSAATTWITTCTASAARDGRGVRGARRASLCPATSLR